MGIMDREYMWETPEERKKSSERIKLKNDLRDELFRLYGKKKLFIWDKLRIKKINKMLKEMT